MQPKKYLGLFRPPVRISGHFPTRKTSIG